jgi:hypothetical protein
MLAPSGGRQGGGKRVVLPVSAYLLDMPDYQFRKVTEFADYSQELFRLRIFCCEGTTGGAFPGQREQMAWLGRSPAAPPRYHRCHRLFEEHSS